MTGYTFAPAAVARAAALFRDGRDPQSVRLRIFHEHPELTGFGVDRVLGIARGEIAQGPPVRQNPPDVPKVPGADTPP
jgi:hypothetical protein